MQTAEPLHPPSLADLIRDGQAASERIKRHTRNALVEWLDQAERLYIAYSYHRVTGQRFADFARRIGVTDRATAYDLKLLTPHRQTILSRCLD